MQLQLDRYASPIGTMLLAWDGQERLRALDFHDCEARMQALFRRRYRDLALAAGTLPATIAGALDGYFAGDLERLDGIVVATAGTPFQERVWAALREIPPGTTTSYGRLAARIGRDGAGRAVGLANGSNPLAVVVPCHRLVGADGGLTGYGGGLERKRWLIDHERRHAGG